MLLWAKFLGTGGRIGVLRRGTKAEMEKVTRSPSSMHSLKGDECRCDFVARLAAPAEARG